MGLFEFYKKEEVIDMLAYTILSLLSLLKQKLYCNIKNVVYMKDDEDIPDIYPKIKIEYNVISDANQLQKYSNDKKFRKDIAKFKYFLNHGCKMYLTLYHNDIVGYYLTCKLNDFKPYLYHIHSLFKGDNKYAIFFCHTFDEYRRNEIYSYILTQICNDTLKKDETVFISTDTKNITSQRGIEKAGFRKLGRLRYKRIKSLVLSEHFNESCME